LAIGECTYVGLSLDKEVPAQREIACYGNSKQAASSALRTRSRLP
jgi:hypothetical protein